MGLRLAAAVAESGLVEYLKPMALYIATQASDDDGTVCVTTSDVVNALGISDSCARRHRVELARLGVIAVATVFIQRRETVRITKFRRERLPKRSPHGDRTHGI